MEPPALRSRVQWLLLVLAAGLGAAEAYCTCPVGPVACGVGDLVLVANSDDTILVGQQGGLGELIAATSCIPDVAGHLEADILVDNNAALESLDLSGLASMGDVIQSTENHFMGSSLTVTENAALESLDLPGLASVGYFIDVRSNDALVSIDLRRLVSVAAWVQISANNAAIVTTLPCAAKAIHKLLPTGAVFYWNEHPTVCHAGSATLGDDGTCGECVEYAGGGASCGGACVSCNVTGAPTLLPGFVRFVDDAAQPGGSAAHVYPYIAASGDGGAATCRCPFNQTICDFNTDLVNAQGQSAAPECLPIAGTLTADVYVYGNAAIETVVTDGITEIGSLTIVACPNLRTISTPAAITVGNMTVESCGSLESISVPTVSTAGLVDVSSCVSLTSLDVATITLIEGDLSIASCGSLAAIHMPVLESVVGSLAISDAEQVSLIHLESLAQVAGSFSIAGVHADAVTRLPCFAKVKPWEHASMGKVEYSTGVAIACHGASTELLVNGTTCNVCDVCVDCDSAVGTPVLMPGFVQFVPGSEQINSPVAHVFECESKFGCHGSSTTGSDATCVASDRYEGHFCASCASGFQHVKAEGEYEYECVDCETANLVASTLVLAAVVPASGGMSTLLWRKYKPATEVETLALQAVIRSMWLPIRCMIVYAQVNSQLGDVLDVRFPEVYTQIMERLGSVLSVSDILVGSECAGLSSFFNKWLKDVVIQPGIMLGVVAVYCSYEWRKSGRQTAIKHATGNAFFVVFFCCQRFLHFRQQFPTLRSF
eukprot:COSAG02_NODE_575_length_20117_cov_5.801139_20_plen_772_part_00